jgi:hypothetical protein
MCGECLLKMVWIQGTLFSLLPKDLNWLLYEYIVHSGYGWDPQWERTRNDVIRNDVIRIRSGIY